MAQQKLGELLVENGLLTHSQLQMALKLQTRWRRKLGEILVLQELIDEKKLVGFLAKIFQVPQIDLTRISASDISNSVLETIPVSLARSKSMVPLSIREVQSRRRLIIATSDPLQLETFDQLRFTSGIPVMVMLAAPSQIDWFIRRFYLGEETIPPVSLDASRSKRRSAPEFRRSSIYSTVEFVEELGRASQSTRRSR